MAWHPTSLRILSPQQKLRRRLVRMAGNLRTPSELYVALGGLTLAERAPMLTIMIPALGFELLPEHRAALEAAWEQDLDLVVTDAPVHAEIPDPSDTLDALDAEKVEA